MSRLFRFTKALFRYAFTGHLKNVPFSEYEKRIHICSECGHIGQNDYRCGVCGCYMDKKAKWATECCAIGKWLSYK